MTAPASTRLTGDLAQTSTGASGSQTQVLGLMEWEINRKAKTVEATTTDDAGDETSLISTRSWDATCKYAYIDQDASQLAQIFDGIGSSASAVEWNFFPDAVTGRGAWYGKAFVTGYKIGAKVGQLVQVDVTLKGTGPLTFGTQLAPSAGVAES
jgi:predicted secreted protein